MAVTSFQDLPLADRDREWDGDAAESRVRDWAGAQDEPNEKYRDAHVWYEPTSATITRPTSCSSPTSWMGSSRRCHAASWPRPTSCPVVVAESTSPTATGTA